jgi:hypothetical protein
MILFSPKMTTRRDRKEVGFQLHDAAMTAGHEKASVSPDLAHAIWQARGAC